MIRVVGYWKVKAKPRTIRDEKQEEGEMECIFT